MDQIFIQYRFTIQQDGLTFQDAIVLPQSEYEVLSAEDIEVLKQERFDNFKKSVIDPPQNSELSKEDKLENIEQDLVSLNQQKEQLLTIKEELIKGDE